ncbi:MAG: hypothetical protein KF910_09185 [Brevundimonas sp.]|uniref:hypothetical protein n=1 Tax=Brevundimonas sp. TaxID=1871086 RepID=UPI0025B97CA3|nr:hypothetical protein [Brevundimonas sp.]MBX3477770.1 hypothetical protein [Brevundimonas sp.]
MAGLTWNRRTADEIWNRRGGAWFEVIDFVDMQYEGKVRPHPVPASATAAERNSRGVQLTYEQLADAKQALNTAAVYFQKLGMAAPKLPIADGKFYVFVLSNMEHAAGATGLALAADPVEGATPAGAAIVPEGTHLMLNSLEYFAPYADHPFSSKITIAHEMVHAIDQYMVITDGPKDGILEGVNKWWSEGSTDSAPQYAFQTLGYVPENTLKHGARSHTKNIGARPYDYPLTLKGVPRRMPVWVSAGLPTPADAADAAEAADDFWNYNATYFTSSFWRFLYKEEAPVKLDGGGTRPGAFELFPVLRTIQIVGTHINKARANSEWVDTGIPALDDFLRDHHPTWGATGLHRAFPAFIAHFVEWPDQVVKSRSGYLAHQKWLDCLFMDGVDKHELTPNKDITVDLTILPLAAKAIRFETPPVFSVAGDEYAPVTISVSVLDGSGQSNPIDNIHVGLRGQCLANGHSQPGRHGRVRRWSSVKATPLNRSKVNNETVLSFINVAPDPSTTRPVRIRVTVSLQVASSTGQPSYHPPPVERAEGPPVHVPPSVAPRGPEQLPIVPVEIGSEKTTLVLIKNADVVRMVNDSLDTASLMAVSRENEDGEQAAIGAAGRPVLGGPRTAEMGQAMMRSLRVELAMPTLALDHIGPVAGAEVAAEWYEPAYVALAQYGVSPGVRVETDAVQVTITSRNEGAVMGSFSADFSRGSQNVDAIFRGRIEGQFCMGIVHDEPAGDKQAPEDPSAMLPTDFFIGLARAGMSTGDIADALRDAVADMRRDEGQDEPPSRSEGGSPGVSTGATGTCTITRGEFDAWFQETYGQVSGLSSAQRSEIRGQLLENWTFTEQMICNIMGRS